MAQLLLPIDRIHFCFDPSAAKDIGHFKYSAEYQGRERLPLLAI